MNGNRKRIIDRILLISFILLLFGCSYLRYTYIINPNFSGKPLLISIEGPKHSLKDTLDLNASTEINISQLIKGKSIIVYWVLFGLFDYLLIRYWRGKRRDIDLFLVTYLGLTLISVIFLILHYLIQPDKVLFSLYAVIKNFLLTPLFTGVILIIARMYDQ